MIPMSLPDIAAVTGEDAPLSGIGMIVHGRSLAASAAST